jgi:transposase-like protein
MPSEFPYYKEGEIVRIPLVWPYCQSDQVVKRGKTDTRKLRYRCQNPQCAHYSFLLDPAYKGRLPEIKQQVIEMSLNGSGVRDTARVLQISTATVILELKKKGQPSRRSIHHL